MPFAVPVSCTQAGINRVRQNTQANLAVADARVEAVQIITQAKDKAKTIIQRAGGFADEILLAARIEAEALLRKADSGLSLPKMPVHEIIRIIAGKHGVSVADVKGPKRTKRLVAARHEAIIAAYRLRKDLTSPQIGREFGRDHTTILHAVKKANRGGTLEAKEEIQDHSAAEADAQCDD